jgi:hypothetical protein
MPGPQVEKLVNQILKTLPHASTLDAAVEEVKAELDTLVPGLSESLASEVAEARALVERQFEQVEILHRHSVIRRRPQWYFGPRPTDRRWPALKSYLSGVKGWRDEDIAAIDDASNEIVSLLESPAQQQFSCRGLVVGHVQSGKTANMTAVIAKALDAGYNTVIILAGLTNKLRFQTQCRLVQDLVERHPLDWQVLTPTSEDGDFRAPAHGGFLAHTDKAQLAVIKKNVSPLGQLREAIERTLPAALSRLRILVVDDECDQASVNSARGELDMTAINQRVRELLTILPAVSYVGYTATPFANVLINPYRVDGQALDDLYPRDFITALPHPSSYFGTEQLFGRPPADPENVQPDEEGLDMIRIVPDEEERLLQPASRRDREAFQPRLAPSLETAILYFLACCATRRARGDAGKHMTMLVHTSAYVAMHERLAALIAGWKDMHRATLLDRTSGLSRRLAKLWLSEQGILPTEITDAPPVGLDAIFDHLPGVLDALEVPVENGASEDRIDYTGSPKTYIVVGGSILARGLTLEGLMVSYFLRTANQYDTLLQMGRWFGYRPRYEDLPRIWMTEDLRLRFRSLAAIEAEIREDIEQYRVRDLTPMDVAVRIRSIPGMAITAANRMKAARRCAVSYWGTHRQTFRFEHRNSSFLRRNWEAGAELVSRADTLGCRDDSSPAKLWRGVPKSSIIRFLETYRAQSTHSDLASDLLVAFINGADSRLDRWNLGVVEPNRDALSKRPLGTVGTLRTVNRSRLNDSGDVADIKALMSKTDIRFDCPGDIDPAGSWEELKAARLQLLGQIPLLLLYPIDKDSRPERQGSLRVPLEAVEDILAYGVVFPGSISEGGNFVSVELKPLSADEVDEIAAEEEAQAEAAGVA